MPRIDEALRRAEGEAGAPVPENPLFQPAWNLPDDGGEVRPAVGPHQPEATIASAAEGEPSLLQASAQRPLAIFQGFNPQVLERLALPSSGDGALVEQFRKLAGSLHHAQQTNGVRTLMVTSAIAGEGKTLTSTNLALTLAESFRRNVLLVDADLRRPSLHDVFQVPNVSGLSDGIKASADAKLSLLQVTPLLTLLTSGRPDPDPMHSLISDRMKRIIEEARARFDWVILDTPPVGLLTDANLLSQMVDTTLLVIQAHVAPYDLVDRAVEIIGADRIFGVVLNAAEPSDSDGQEYYYYGRYHRKA